MKILIPDDITEAQLMKITSISSNIRIAKLTIITNYNVFWRAMRFVSRKYLPCQLYERIRYFLDRSYCRREFLVEGKNSSGVLRNIEAFLCHAGITPDIFIKLLPILPDLKWIHSTITGVDHILSYDLLIKDKVITSSIGIHKKRIAEFVIALILTAAKKIPKHLQLQQKKQWQVLSSDEIEGKTLCIIGFGNIGQEVAKRARALGMKVVATKRNKIEIKGVTVHPPEKLRELLKTSDYVVITAPLVRETSGMIGEEELRLMKKNAYLINVSRGDIVQEKALIRALRENWIAGGCIDVFSQEPLPQNHPFYSIPNLIITHHSSYASSKSGQEVFNLFLANLKRYINGENLLNIVNHEKGY